MKFLTCDALNSNGIAHGFFGRQGGSSTGIYASLNCGYGSGDDKSIVAKNRKAVAQALGAKGDDLFTAFQIHSDKAVIIDSPWQQDNAPEADAIVTNTPNLPIGVLTADCVPVLFADAQARVIAAAHAGWKGAYSGILESTLQSMETLGATRNNITACIGPAISQKSYEIGPEFYEKLVGEAQSNTQFFTPSTNVGHHLFDLKAYVREKLAKAQITQINLLAHDTYSEEDGFFSFRRATHRGETAYGRQVSAIMLAS